MRKSIKIFEKERFRRCFLLNLISNAIWTTDTGSAFRKRIRVLQLKSRGTWTQDDLLFSGRQVAGGPAPACLGAGAGGRGRSAPPATPSPHAGAGSAPPPGSCTADRNYGWGFPCAGAGLDTRVADPAFHSIANPDLAFHSNADPDPDTQESNGNLRPLLYKFSRTLFWASRQNL